MAVVPTVANLSDGVLTSTTLNAGLVAATQFLLTPPIANLRQTVAQTLTSSTFAPLTFDAEDIDKSITVGGHDNVTNNTRWTCVYAGYHQISGGIGFSNLSTPGGRRGGHFAINGTLVSGSSNLFAPAAGGGAAGSLAARSVIVYLFAGDYVELRGYFEGGGTLLTNISAEDQSHMSIRWISN
jgi:hypothetical protein